MDGVVRVACPYGLSLYVVEDVRLLESLRGRHRRQTQPILVGMIGDARARAFVVLLFVAEAVGGCRREKDEFDSGALRWGVVPNAAGAAVLTAGAFEDDYGEGVTLPILAGTHSVCDDGVLGIGKECTAESPTIQGAADDSSVEIVLSGALERGANDVRRASYRDPKRASSFSVRNALFEVLEVEVATGVQGPDGAKTVAWLCARGAADVVDSDTVVGALRFTVDYRDRYATNGAPPPCSP